MWDPGLPTERGLGLGFKPSLPHFPTPTSLLGRSSRPHPLLPPVCAFRHACSAPFCLGYEGTTTGTWSLRPNLRAQCGNGVHWQRSHPKWPRPPSSTCDVHLARLILKPQRGGGSSVHSPWNPGSQRVWGALWGRGRGGRTFCSLQVQ